MKKTFFTAAALLGLFISTSAFSPKSKSASFRITTPQIEKSFLEEFGDQANVEWSREGTDMVHATFTVDDQTANAYFDNDGNYVCSTVPVTREGLPLKIKMALNKDFATVSINAILQMNNPDETAYFFQATDNKGTKVWKAYSNGTIQMFKKLK
ncbi:MAG: hypothetical protein ABIX01_12325 [Chitinophagaceae bacterium]